MRIFLLLLFSFLFFFIKSFGQVKPSSADQKYDTLYCGKIETDAFFTGGIEAWKSYVRQRIDTNIFKNEGLPGGSYQVIVQYKIFKDGSITNVRPLTKNGYRLEQSISDIITSAPRWNPATQNGRQVNHYRKDTVNITVAPTYRR